MSINIILDTLAVRIGHQEVLQEVEQWLEKQKSKESEVYLPSSLQEWIPPVRSIDLTTLPDDLQSSESEGSTREESNSSQSSKQDTCIGCIEDQPNQQAHMDFGGCLYDY